MLTAELAAVGVVTTAALAAGAVAARALTPLAGLVAAGFGTAIVLSTGFAYLALLVLFVVATTLATRYHFEEKRRRHVQEGSHGERGISNVLAHIVIPAGLALSAGAGLISLSETAVLYASALAFGAADTFASEFGVLAGTARSILSFRTVPAGTNGGVSVVGELFALAGSVVTSVVGLAVFDLFREPLGPESTFLLVVGLAGFLGCQVDSLLGETLENRGVLTKGSTNFLGMLATVVIAAAVFSLAGGAA